MMNLPVEIEEAKSRLETLFPAASITVDEPYSALGTWWIDLRFEGKQTAFSWRRGQGFGFYAEEEVGFGARPNRIVVSPAKAFELASSALRQIGAPARNLAHVKSG